MMTDPIADMLTRIRNAGMARQERTNMPLSKMKCRVAEILEQEGYISGHKVDEQGFGTLTLFLKYGADRRPAIRSLKRTSRPGRRIYSGYRDLPKVKDGLGVAIVSTSKGLMSDKSARAQKLGGEVVCEVW